MGSRRQILRLMLRLHAASMLGFRPLRQIPRYGRGRLFCGAFGVSKSADEDRFIGDRRPANSEEEAQDLEEALPLAAQLGSIVLGLRQVLRACGEDLRNFYHYFRASSDRARRSALAFPVRVGELRALGAELPELRQHGDDFQVAGCLLTLIMGDGIAVPVAQAAHLGVLRAGGAAEHTLQYGTAVPRALYTPGGVVEAVYVDDYRAMTILDEADAGPSVEGPDTRAAGRARAAYAAAGLETHAGKQVVNTVDDTFLGSELVAGHELWPHRQKLLQIIAITTCIVLEVVELTRLQAQELQGLWIPALTTRRPTLCLLSAMFSWTTGLPDEGATPIPPAVRDELMSLVLLAPFMFVDLRTPVSCELHAVDATRTRGGGAVAEVPQHVAHELFRLSQVKGELLPLDRAALRKYWPDEREVTGADQVVMDLLDGLDFKQTFAHDYSRAAHINYQEEAAVATLARRDARSCARHGRRVVVVQDSRVSVGAGRKGRSRARRLNAKMKSALPFVLGGGLHYGRLWTPTDKNPADAPTRHRRIRDARPHLPYIASWLADANAVPQALDTPAELAGATRDSGVAPQAAGIPPVAASPALEARHHGVRDAVGARDGSCRATGDMARGAPLMA